jgi:predicted RNA binding protein YcfA (HicA-like mRNA interferase family)
MGKLEKLLLKFRALPPEIRFTEVAWLLEQYGYIEVRSKGSHHHFRHGTGKIISVPKTKGKMVKLTYLKLILNLLELEAS